MYKVGKHQSDQNIYPGFQSQNRRHPKSTKGLVLKNNLCHKSGVFVVLIPFNENGHELFCSQQTFACNYLRYGPISLLGSGEIFSEHGRCPSTDYLLLLRC